MNKFRSFHTRVQLFSESNFFESSPILFLVSRKLRYFFQYNFWYVVRLWILCIPVLSVEKFIGKFLRHLTWIRVRPTFSNPSPTFSESKSNFFTIRVQLCQFRVQLFQFRVQVSPNFSIPSQRLGTEFKLDRLWCPN